MRNVSASLRSAGAARRKPGPKPPPKVAADGTLCPPGSEGARMYRGIRGFRRKCKYGGHRKTHPGRCLICARERDKRRDKSRRRKAIKRAAGRRWSAKPENKAKIAAWAHRRNQEPDRKIRNAELRRMYYRLHPPAHRAMWIRYRGPIPKGHIVHLKRLPLKLANLELVSRRDWMARNTIARFPPEVRKAIWALHVLTRAIKEKA